jgi:protein-L-isoaspartate(D-aspartate) O-methyltransferase
MGTEPEEARQRNEQLVATLVDTGILRDPRVISAFRQVFRHHFLPGSPLDEVYEDTAITIKRSETGVPVSSSSQPAMMAIMLQQLRPRPGERVLEVGAGTGYNAALLARIVGPKGGVVTVDLDADLAAAARAHLQAAGMQQVEVVCGDGAAGWPPGAPYHRIIVTASVDDLAPAWLEQLTEGGRLVVPLSLLGGPVQLCLALVRRGRALLSRSVTACGFLPLRGDLGRRRHEEAAAPGPEAAARLGPREAAGEVPAADLRGGFETWLALSEPGYVRARPRAQDPEMPGLRDEGGLALLEGDGKRLSVVVYGDGGGAARRLLAAHEAWARRRPPLQEVRVAAYPAGEAPPAGPSQRTIWRPNFTFLLTPP